MNFRSWPRTDVGTVVLHWGAVIAVAVLLLTGLRFTSDDAHHRWLRDYDGWLLKENLWKSHMIAGYALTFAAVAYASYMSKARLSDHIRLDVGRVKGLFVTAKTRWSTINIMICWAFLVAALGACITGWMVYLEVAGPALRLHRLCTWVILGFPALHLFALLRVGGVPHVVRIFRPKRAEAVAEEIDLANVVSDLLAARQQAQRAASGKPGQSN